MRLFLSYAFILILSVFVGGCEENQNNKPQQSSDNKSDPAQDVIQIALVMKTLTNPFFIQMEIGARRAEKEFDISLIVKTAAQETSTSQQIRIVEQLVEENKVKAIVIAPADSVKLIPSLKKAQDIGMHIINIDNQLDVDFSRKANLTNVPFISVDNERSAYLSAKIIATGIEVPSDVGILEGIREAANANQRKKGAIKAFGENPQLKIVASETAHWKIDEGYDVTKKMFEDHPNITVLFAANDMMALGAIEYLKESNRKNVRVAAFDAIAEARAVLKEGWLDVTIDQQPAEQGYLGIKYALQAIRGEEVSAVTMLEGLVIKQ